MNEVVGFGNQKTKNVSTKKVSPDKFLRNPYFASGAGLLRLLSLSVSVDSKKKVTQDEDLDLKSWEDIMKSEDEVNNAWKNKGKKFVYEQ